MHESLGIKRAQPQVNKSPWEIRRSDKIPGIYTCVECGVNINLMESWRAPASGPGMNNTSTLFCANCAAKVNMQGAIQIAPIQFDAFDKLNLGVRCPEFNDPSMSRPLNMAQPEQQGEVAPETPAARWNKLIG